MLNVYIFLLKINRKYTTSFHFKLIKFIILLVAFQFKKATISLH